VTQRSVAEARNSLSELIERVLGGEEVVITRHGLPVVELKAVRPKPRPMTLEDLQRLRTGRVGKAGGPNAGDLLGRMRDEDDERLLRR
jgi:prevent-host-death family protein